MSIADSFLRLNNIMHELREKCPWDKKQTIQTLRSMTIEETYELADAIDNTDWKGIKEELGDVMLHILFYSVIAEEQNKFTIKEVMEGISDKLVARHPHIYGDVKLENADEVKQNWEKLKLKEGKTSVLSGVPNSLPAVAKATLIQNRAKQVGFEWDNKEDVFKKIQEELDELQVEVNENNTEKIEEELGDVLFSIINYARFLKTDAEAALEKTNKKFISRFKKMEEIAIEKGTTLHQLTLEEMDELWNTIKKQTK